MAAHQRGAAGVDGLCDWRLRRNKFNGDRKLVVVKGHAGHALDRQHKIIRDVLSDDDPSTWTIPEVLVYPAYVIEDLTERLVSTSSKFKFNNDEALICIDAENIDPTALDLELHARFAVMIIHVQPGLDAGGVLCKEVAEGAS